jgi:hypothetical protein
MSYKINSLIDFSHNFDGFANISFLKLCADFFHLKLRYLVIDKNSEIMAVYPYFYKKKYGMKIVVKPFIQYYQPIHFFFQKRKRINENVKIEFEILSEIAFYLKKNFFFIETNLSPEIQDIRPFFYQRYKTLPLYTLQIDLKNNLLENYHSSVRKSIKKAEKKSIRFEENLNFNIFVHLHNLTFKRQKKKFPLDNERLLELLKKLADENLIRQFNAKYNNEIVASRIVVYDFKKKVVYDFLAASNPELISLGINSYLIFKMIKYLKSEFDIFDFCGANIPKIAEFKSHFDSRLKTFFKINWTKFSL